MSSISPSDIRYPLKEEYDGLVQAGQVQLDNEQVRLIELLDQRLKALSQSRLSRKSSALGWLMGKGASQASAVKGLYIWGGVGRGKSMLMDMFFQKLPHKRKRRHHFNEFMQMAQEQIHAHRQAFKNGSVKEEDPIPVVAKNLAEDMSVLCFDEFTVTDIADAMILGRLFQVLFEEGVTIIATSNVEPANLYKDGLNRKIFLPFIDLLLENVDVFNLDAQTDYRLEKLNRSPVYLQPLTSDNRELFEKAWAEFSAGGNNPAVQIQLKGRSFEIDKVGNGAARLTFEELCVQPRSAEDYLALSRKFHTIFIENVPILEKENSNAAKRFILLIDTLYDNGIRVVVYADAPAEKLYTATSGTEAFEFDRTVSRLIEMQSEEYIGERL